MDNRKYNILFDLHTVSGIILSVLLYVIFFAGSFSFFRDEIVNWERDQSVSVRKDLHLDVNAALASLKDSIPLNGRDIEIGRHYDESRVSVSINPSKDSLASEAAKKKDFFYLDSETFKPSTYQDSYSLGEFLYRLHFFAQIPYPAGYYLSGFSALFLIFVLLTGILIHWKKIFSNFFVFRPGKKLKTVWTDAHTVLGTIGLPFQLVYAVTGAFFMIKALLLAPIVLGLYDGDEVQVYADLEYTHPSFDYAGERLDKSVDFNGYKAETKKRWKGFDVTHIHIYNYGDIAMHIRVEGELKNHIKYTGLGGMTFKASTGEMVEEKDPFQATSYLDAVKNILFRLHFGDYAGYTLKVGSFLLGLLSCIVIISGIMVWLEARNKKNVSEKKKRQNNMVSNIYLAICLSMFPVTALSFIVTKVLGPEFDPLRQSILYSVYFISWLTLAVFFSLKRDNAFTNKYTLLFGAILGVFIPNVNGIVSGNWIWITLSSGQYDILLVDLLWLGISVMAFYSLRKIRQKGDTKEPQMPIETKKVTQKEATIVGLVR